MYPTDATLTAKPSVGVDSNDVSSAEFSPTSFVAFKTLVAPMTPESFIKGYWERIPLHQKSINHPFGDLSERTPHEIITLVHASAPGAIEILRYDKAAEPARALSETLHAYSSGYTIRINHVHLYFEDLNRFVWELESELSAPVSINLYATPPRSQGTDRHYDRSEIFVVQTHGSKGWRVYPQTIKLPVGYSMPYSFEDWASARKRMLDSNRNRVEERQGAVAVIDDVLTTGSMLYLPRGYWHEAATGSDESVHLSISINALTYGDVLGAAISEAASRILDLRQSMPLGFARSGFQTSHTVAVLQRAAQRFFDQADLAAALSNTAEAFVKSRRKRAPSPRKTESALDMSSRVCHSVAAFYRASLEDAEAILSFGDVTIRGASSLAPVFHFISANPEFAVHELPDVLDDAGKLALIRHLAADGFLEIKADACG